MATVKQVKYKGKKHDVIKTHVFNNRTFYTLKGVEHSVSEKLIETAEDPTKEETT